MSFGNTKTPTKPTGKSRWQVPMRPNTKYPTIMEYYLDDELKERFCKEFPKHSNRRIMQWFGISFSTLQRFKRELGLQKDMQKIRKEQAADVKKICEKNGYYDSLRGKAPSEAALEAIRKLWAEGFHPIKQLKKNNPRKYKRLMQKRSEARKELIRKERRRVSLGLTPHTNLSAHLLLSCRPFTKAEVSKRHNALKRGYIISLEPGDRYALFYDSETQRSERFEQNCISIGMRIEPYKQYKTL